MVAMVAALLQYWLYLSVVTFMLPPSECRENLTGLLNDSMMTVRNVASIVLPAQSGRKIVHCKNWSVCYTPN